MSATITTKRAMPIQSPVASLTLAINVKVMVIVSLCKGSIHINAGAMGIVVGLHAEYVEVKFDGVVFRVRVECIDIHEWYPELCMMQLPLVLGYALLLSGSNCLAQVLRFDTFRMPSRNIVIIRVPTIEGQGGAFVQGTGFIAASLMVGKNSHVTIALLTATPLCCTLDQQGSLLKKIFTLSPLQKIVAMTIFSGGGVQSVLLAPRVPDTPPVVATGSTSSRISSVINHFDVISGFQQPLLDITEPAITVTPEPTTIVEPTTVTPTPTAITKIATTVKPEPTTIVLFEQSYATRTTRSSTANRQLIPDVFHYWRRTEDNILTKEVFAHL